MRTKDTKEKRPTVALSGGFDPPSEGQIAMILDATELGDVMIILNSDVWCAKQRYDGKHYMPWERRRNLLLNIPGVINVVAVDDADDTVCEAIDRHRPDFFGNGGGRTVENTPEVMACKRLGIGLLWLLGKDSRATASSVLYQAINTERHMDNKQKEENKNET